MRNPFRNIRIPGRKSHRYQPRHGRGRAPQRQFTLARVERPRPKREIHVPWRRIAFSAIGVGTVAGLMYGAAWLVTGDSLRVQQIDVTGAQVTDAREIAAASSVGSDSMLTLDLAAAEAAIGRLPAVKSVTVERDWPRLVRITVQEHQAWGYWQAAGRVYVIDRDGNILRAARPAPADAPTIIDLASPQDLETGRLADADTVHLVERLVSDRVFPDAGLQPTAWIFQRDRGLTVIAQDGPDAVFGDSSNYEFKVQAFEQVLRHLRAREATGAPRVAEVDLRFGRNVVLR